MPAALHASILDFALPRFLLLEKARPEEDGRFVRFHALQSLVFFGGMSLILGVLGRVPVIGWIIAIIGGIITFGFWIIGTSSSHAIP